MPGENSYLQRTLVMPTFPFPVCTVPGSVDRTSRCNKIDTVRLYALCRLNLLLLKGQRCVKGGVKQGRYGSIV